MQQHTRTFYELVSIIGLAITYVMWGLWHEIVFIVSQLDLLQALPAIVGFLLTIIMVTTVISCIAIFVNPHKVALLIVYTTWSLPLILHNEIPAIGVVWMCMYIIICLSVTWVLHNQLELFIKPVLYRIIPNTIKTWFILFSVLLASTIILHPTIRSTTFEIEIPQGLWNSLWNIVDLDAAVDQQIPANVQGVRTMSLDQLVEKNTANGALSIENIQELLKEYGLSPNELSQLETVTIDDPSSYFQGVEGNISESIKEQTEILANNFIEPFKGYLPYMLGFSFFISAQFITPLLGYITYILVEIVVKFLLKFSIVKIVQVEKVTERYVLQ